MMHSFKEEQRGRAIVGTWLDLVQEKPQSGVVVPSLHLMNVSPTPPCAVI